MLFICCWVSGGGLGVAFFGSFAHVHGMVCFCGAAWVSVGQSTSSRYARSVARVLAGSVLMIGMVACHCYVALPLVGRSDWGIWIGVWSLVRRMVLWFARHRCGPVSLRARSPSHRRSHVLSGMFNTPRCWRAFLPNALSSCFLSSLRGLVAAAILVLEGFGLLYCGKKFPCPCICRMPSGATRYCPGCHPILSLPLPV
jgi:hypothetical protein